MEKLRVSITNIKSSQNLLHFHLLMKNSQDEKFRGDPKKSLLRYTKCLVTKYQIWHSRAMVILFFFFLNKKKLSDFALMGHDNFVGFFHEQYFFFFSFFFLFLFFILFCFLLLLFLFSLIDSDGPPQCTFKIQYYFHLKNTHYRHDFYEELIF